MRRVEIVGTRGYPSYYGGFETAVRKIAPYLADSGWKVTVYCRKGSTMPDDTSRDSRIETIYTPGTDSRSLSTITYGFTSMFSAMLRRPDAVLIMNVANCLWLPLLKLRNIPTAVNVDGIEWERQKWGPLAKRVFMLGARATAAWADKVVVDAEAIGSHWREKFGRAGVFIPYGGSASDELPVPEGLERRRYVLVVSRLVPENSIPAFLQAAESLGRDYKIVIVGSSGYGGQLDDWVKEMAATNENIVAMGHVRDDSLLASLWQHAGVYFHGHTVGGTNPALVQAMALGAPTIAARTQFNSEVLGLAGELVDPAAESIELAIRALLADPLRQELLSQEARRRAAECYSWEEVGMRYERLLEELVP